MYQQQQLWTSQNEDLLGNDSTGQNCNYLFVSALLIHLPDS